MRHQAIITKYLGPTNFKGSRIMAKAAAGRVTVHYDYGQDQSENHARAAKALAEKFGWGGHWVAGGMPSEDGDVFVCTALETAETYGPNGLPIFTPAFTTTQREG